MGIIATDIGGLLFTGLLVATIAAVPLFILYGIRAALRKPPKPAVFTEREMDDLYRLKYRYETTEEVNR